MKRKRFPARIIILCVNLQLAHSENKMESFPGACSRRSVPSFLGILRANRVFRDAHPQLTERLERASYPYVLRTGF